MSARPIKWHRKGEREHAASNVYIHSIFARLRTRVGEAATHLTQSAPPAGGALLHMRRAAAMRQLARTRPIPATRRKCVYIYIYTRIVVVGTLTRAIYRYTILLAAFHGKPYSAALHARKRAEENVFLSRAQESEVNRCRGEQKVSGGNFYR